VTTHPGGHHTDRYDGTGRPLVSLAVPHTADTTGYTQPNLTGVQTTPDTWVRWVCDLGGELPRAAVQAIARHYAGLLLGPALPAAPETAPDDAEADVWLAPAVTEPEPWERG